MLALAVKPGEGRVQPRGWAQLSPEPWAQPSPKALNPHSAWHPLLLALIGRAGATLGGQVLALGHLWQVIGTAAHTRLWPRCEPLSMLVIENPAQSGLWAGVQCALAVPPGKGCRTRLTHYYRGWGLRGLEAPTPAAASCPDHRGWMGTEQATPAK